MGVDAIRTSDLEKGLAWSEQNGWGYGPMSLSKTSLVQLCRRLNSEAEPIGIVELGGGQSTLFWQALLQLGAIDARVTTLEHHTAWAAQLASRVGAESRIEILPQTLKQVTDGEWAQLFRRPAAAAAAWSSVGAAVPVSMYETFTIRNTFYAEADRIPWTDRSIDVLIVDGPHGNGRSLAFPLFCRQLKPDALVLVDDFDHYPFLDDLERVFRFDELYREAIGEKRSVLLRLNGLAE